MNSKSDLTGQPYGAFFQEQLNRFVMAHYAQREPLAETIRYVLAGEGKAVRAVLALMSAEIFSGDFRRGLVPAIAVEMVHAYSLIHDDLPCLDDDDVRRGRPSAHKQFDEARALLAGDALLTDAFWVLSRSELTDLQDQVRLSMVGCLAQAAGSRGMVLGQMSDVHWTGQAKRASQSDLDRMHAGKTGGLLGAACCMGAYAGGASPDEALELYAFGETLGIAYQAVDDLLDPVEGTGKTTGKDAAKGKLTYLSVATPAEVSQRAEDLTAQALGHLPSFGGRGAVLARFARGLLGRRT